MQAKVYALIDPRTGKVRYIGRTTRLLKYRLGQHLWEATQYSHYRANWIKGLLKQGLIPEIKELIKCSWKESAELEKHYISIYPNLVNGTVGGEGAVGAVRSKETCKKMSVSLRKARSYKVYQFSLNSKLVASYNSVPEAAERTKLRAANIVQCCNGSKKSHGGFLWSKKTKIKAYSPKSPSEIKYRIIWVYTLKDKFVKKFKNITEASKFTKASDSNIHKCLKGVYKQSAGYKYYLHEQ